MDDVANEIARRRNALRMTQDLLAGAAGVSRSTVQRAEKGLPVSHENARAIYAVLQMPHETPHAEDAESAPEQDTQADAAEGIVHGRVWPTTPLRPRIYYATRNNAISSVAIGIVMSVTGVLLAGPHVQKGMMRAGHPSQWVQSWSEVILTVFLATLVLAVQFAMMSDEKRVLAGDNAKSPALAMLGVFCVTISGMLVFLSTIVPVLIATS